MKMDNKKSDDQDIRELLLAAGLRKQPPQEMRERVYAATKEAWQELPDQSTSQTALFRRVSMHTQMAAAAAILVAVLLGLFVNQTQQSTSDTVAEIVYVQGDYQLDHITNNSVQSLSPGMLVQTKNSSFVSLRMASGVVITMDQRTETRILGGNELQLDSGRIYVDAGDESGGDTPLTIVTQYAKILDIGTQFEVQVSDADQRQQIRVTVREGRVDVIGHNATYHAAARAGVGEELLLIGVDLVERNHVPTTDRRWDWRKAGRAPYVLSESTIYDYLQWLARDTGNELRFASRSVKQMTQIGVLQSQGGLTSDDTNVKDTLAATRFEILEPQEGLWIVKFRATS